MSRSLIDHDGLPDLDLEYRQQPTDEQRAWLADPTAGDWLTLVNHGDVPRFMLDGIRTTSREPWQIAADLGVRWMPRLSLDALALALPCSRCHAPSGIRCSGRTHQSRQDQAARALNRAVSHGPWPEHREPGRCYVQVPA